MHEFSSKVLESHSRNINWGGDMNKKDQYLKKKYCFKVHLITVFKYILKEKLQLLVLITIYCCYVVIQVIGNLRSSVLRH